MVEDVPAYFRDFEESIVESDRFLIPGENNYLPAKVAPLEDLSSSDELSPKIKKQKDELNSSETKKILQTNEVVEECNKDEPFCRLCWDNENDKSNPLISVCKCSGGV